MLLTDTSIEDTLQLYTTAAALMALFAVSCNTESKSHLRSHLAWRLAFPAPYDTDGLQLHCTVKPAMVQSIM